MPVNRTASPTASRWVAFSSRTAVVWSSLASIRTLSSPGSSKRLQINRTFFQVVTVVFQLCPLRPVVRRP